MNIVLGDAFVIVCECVCVRNTHIAHGFYHLE